MKQNFIFRLFSSVAVVAVTLATFSCSDDDNTPPTSSEAVEFTATTAVPSGYSYGITNDKSGNTYFVADANGDGTGEITKIGFVLPKAAARSEAAVTNGTALFGGQQVRSITIDGVTYKFAAKTNGKIDVTIVCAGQAQTIADVAVSSLLGNTATGVNTFSEKLKAAFAQISNATDIIALANEKISDDSKLKKEVEAIAQSVVGLKSDANVLNNSKTMETVVKNVTDKSVAVDTTGIAAADTLALNNTVIEDWPEIPTDSVDWPEMPLDSADWNWPEKPGGSIPDMPRDTVIQEPVWPVEPTDSVKTPVPEYPKDSLSITNYIRRRVLRR